MPLFTTEICTLDKDIVEEHKEHEKMLKYITANGLCIPTQEYLDIPEDKKPILLTKGVHFICGDDIEKDLEAWKTKVATDLKDAFSGIEISDLKDIKKKMKEIEEKLNTYELLNQNPHMTPHRCSRINKLITKSKFLQKISF